MKDEGGAIKTSPLRVTSLEFALIYLRPYGDGV